MTFEARVRPIRVALDVRMPHNQWGGVQQVAAGLAQGLGSLDGEDEYLFLSYADAASWLDPLLGGRARRVEVPSSWGRTRTRRGYDAFVARAPALRRLLGQASASVGRSRASIPLSDGRVESLGVDVIHFVTPQAYRTAVPSVYQPHDLLHVHEPEQFSALHLDYRERAYRVFCEQAACVVTMTDWGRSDVSDHYGINRERIAVVPWPPVVLPSRPQSAETVADPERYLLYPAQTWPHKNHLVLVSALSLLRDRGINLRIICTGRLTEHYGAIARRAAAEAVTEGITFTGYLDDMALGQLYANATAVVFPSRFEGWGLPVVEAFASGVPVACSGIPVLQEVVGDAALLFDPLDPESVANAMARIWTDGALRSSLRTKGFERVRGLTWTRTAKTYRALYRRVADAGLTDEDRSLLQPPTLVND